LEGREEGKGENTKKEKKINQSFLTKKEKLQTESLARDVKRKERKWNSPSSLIRKSAHGNRKGITTIPLREIVAEEKIFVKKREKKKAPTIP